MPKKKYTFIDLFASANGIKRSKHKNGKLIDGKVLLAMQFQRNLSLENIEKKTTTCWINNFMKTLSI